MPTKECRKCKKIKPTSEFYARARVPDGLRSWCKECDRAAERNLRYGLTESQYLDLLEAQNGVCAICNREDEEGKNLCVDHDHSCCNGRNSCGKCVRALLCGKCNKVLGLVNDQTETLVDMIEYLKGYANA